MIQSCVGCVETLHDVSFTRRVWHYINVQGARQGAARHPLPKEFKMTYRVYNNHGIPCCGCEVIDFDDFDEVQDYCMEHENDMNDGYITIEEVY